MTVNALVRDRLENLPTLNADRWAALFDILGASTGYYEWSAGAVICLEDWAALRQDQPLIRDVATEVERLRQEWRAQLESIVRYADDDAERETSQAELAAGPSAADEDFFASCARKHCARLNDVLDHLDERVRTGRQPERLGGISESYSLLASIPDDAEDEWLDACEETARFVLACQHSTYLSDADLHPERALKLSPEMLDELDKILGLSYDSPEARDRELAAERQQILRADAATVARNHALARAALERIAQLRTSRAR